MPEIVTTPGQRALCIHHEILQGHALACQPGLHEDLALYLATWPLDQISEDCAEAARAHGHLAQLEAELEAIRKREGLTGDEYWPIGEAPADYEAVSRQSDETMERIRDGIFAQLIRRYFGDTLADRFEQHRADFEVAREVGRRMVIKADPDRGLNEWIADEILRKYGRAAHEQLLKRLKEEGL